MKTTQEPFFYSSPILTKIPFGYHRRLYKGIEFNIYMDSIVHILCENFFSGGSII